MSKTSSTASAATKKGDKFTPKTTLNADMLRKHKLRGNTENAQRYVAFRAEKQVKHFSRMFSNYRVLVHGVTTNHRLASPLRSMAHYFSIPMTKMDNSASSAPAAQEATSSEGTA